MGELARLKIDFCCKDNLDKRSQSHAMVGFDFSPFGLKQHMAEMWKTRLRFVTPSWLAKTAKITGTVWEKWRIVCLAIHGKFEFQNICELQTKDNLNWLKKFKDQIGPRRHNTREIWKRHFLLWKRIKCFRPHYSGENDHRSFWICVWTSNFLGGFTVVFLCLAFTKGVREKPWIGLLKSALLRQGT